MGLIKLISGILKHGVKQLPGFITGAAIAYSSHSAVTQLQDSAYYHNHTYQANARQGRVDSRPKKDKVSGKLIQQLYDSESNQPIEGWALSKYILPIDNSVTIDLLTKKSLEESDEERLQLRQMTHDLITKIDTSLPKQDTIKKQETKNNYWQITGYAAAGIAVCVGYRKIRRGRRA